MAMEPTTEVVNGLVSQDFFLDKERTWTTVSRRFNALEAEESSSLPKLLYSTFKRILGPYISFVGTVGSCLITAICLLRNFRTTNFIHQMLNNTGPSAEPQIEISVSDNASAFQV